jgi:hypothetical protein
VGFDFWGVMLGPIADGVEREGEGAAERGERIFDHGWNDGIDLAGDKAILLESAEGLGEHFLGDAGDFALKLVVAQGAIRQAAEDEGGPFAADPGEEIAGWAAGMEDTWTVWHLRET